METHFGTEFYNQMYEIYMTRDYQFLINRKKELEENGKTDDPTYEPLCDALGMRYELIHG